MTTGTAPAPVSAWARAALLVICGLAALLYGLYWTPYGGDDPWITYRYAENLARGAGFVYNEGERILGTTTPLYTMILAAAGRLGLPVPATSWVINFAAMIAAILLLFLLVRRLGGEVAGVLAAGLLASGHLFHRIATLGMETSLYVALMIGAFLAWAAGRELLAAGLAGLCLLMRPDGAAVGGAIFLVHLVSRREVPWRGGLVYLAVVLPWFLFAWVYFDTLLPNTLAAKRLHTEQTVLLWLPRWLLREPRTLPGLAGLGLLLAAPATRWLAAPLVAWLAAYVLAFSLGGTHGYFWYYTPLLPVLAAGAGVAGAALGERLGRTAPARLGLAGAFGALLFLPDAGRAWLRLRGDEAIFGIERYRMEAALWMRDSLPPGIPIATGGIGMVGYHTGRTIYDAMGLVTPGSMRLMRPLEDPGDVAYPRFLEAIIEDYQPEYVFDGFFLPEGQAMPDFMVGRYVERKAWPVPGMGSLRFVLFQRVPLPAASPGPSP